MVNQLTRRQRCAAAAIYLIPLALCQFLVGCSSTPLPPLLTFSSTQSDRQYSQKFSQAFYTRSPSGEYDAVLLADGITQVENKSGGPLQPSPTAPLSQTLYVHLRWVPEQGAKPDAPTSSNAVIDWYIHSNEASEQNDHLHYRGGGFVKVSQSKYGALFNIVTAHLDLADSGGRMQDPLGPSTLTGSFTATRNDATVASTLSSLSAQPQVSPNDQGPPPRTPQP